MPPVLGAANYRARFRPCPDVVSLARSSAAIAIARVDGLLQGPVSEKQEDQSRPLRLRRLDTFRGCDGVHVSIDEFDQPGSSRSYREATRTAQNGSDGSSVTRSISLHLLAFHTQKIIASTPRSSGSGGSCRRGSDPSYTFVWHTRFCSILLSHINQPIRMQDSSPSSPSSVALSAKLAIPKQPNKGISDAQKKALRIYASKTHPNLLKEHAPSGFRHINRATVSKIFSSKYEYLDTNFAGQNKRRLVSRWPLLDEVLYIWQQRHENAGFPITDPSIQRKAVEFWKKIPQYKDLDAVIL